ncbi:MAG: hypothetical protein K0S46_887 [Moraxellaceae bacterium]|jgi:hypothetical protein|nr:hypothetical protein [Moraxellaceae bacterium]
MNMLRTASLALLLLTACASLPGRDSDIDALLTASGLDAQLAWLQQPLQPDSDSGVLSLLPDEWVSVVNGTVADIVKADVIRSSLRDEIRRNLSARELAEVQKFYESPTGRQVAALESGRLDARLDETRDGDTATLDALADATGVSKAVSQLAENALGDAVDIALKNGCFGLDKTPLASLLGGVMKKAQLRALRAAVNERIRVRYAALSPDDQSRYLAFARSRAGNRFFASRTGVMTGAAQQAGTALGAQLTPQISKICNEK